MSNNLLQLFPQASTRVTGLFMPSEEMGFFQLWFEGSSDPNETPRPHVNWGAVAGLALSLALSATFWVGVVWMVVRIPR